MENNQIPATPVVEVEKEGRESYFVSLDVSKIEQSLEEMMKAGVHFGHQKARRNPKMDEYIFTTRKGINIIDLQKTQDKINEALEFIKSVKKSGKSILFVGTKIQAKDLV